MGNPLTPGNIICTSSCKTARHEGAIYLRDELEDGSPCCRQSASSLRSFAS